MKHYNDQEVDEKIHAFLSKKLQKYPELAGDDAVKHPTVVVKLPMVTRSLIWTMAN